MPTRPERPRLLVPFDGTAAAERVLRAACQGAKDDDAPLVVLCVVPVPVGHAAEETPPDVQTSVMRALVQAMDVCREEGVIAPFHETYAMDLADEILRVADQMQARVIAMPLEDGAPGETQLMSPTVQRVLAGAHCTVMLEPTRPESIDVLRINGGSGRRRSEHDG
jgi:nucleotide-binding universal stress UspA family protein